MLSSGAGPEGPIVAFVQVLLLFEASLYSAVTPVLPHYAHVLGASKPAVGVLTAAYPAGLIPGSFLGGWLAVHVGVKRTTLFGLLLFAVSAIAFGFGSDIATLDLLRFVQGVASGCIWGGGLTWVIAVAPRQRRGEVLGSTIGAAILGTLLGPVLGTLAVAIGTGVVFSLVGAVSIGLAFWTGRHPEPPRPEASPRTSLRSLVGNRRIVLGFWLILLVACTVGATGTLLPLRLAQFGASGVLIGVTFLVSALLSYLLAAPIGRAVDRRGEGLSLTVGLVTMAGLLAVLPVPRSAVLLAVLTVAAFGPPLTACTIPAMSVMTAAAERAGIAIALATMLLNLGWATGETIGAPVAANLSQATSDAVPLIVLAVIMLLTLWPVRRARLNREIGVEGRPQDPALEAERGVPVGTR
jgi:predicted MFS family arabinose efflux permease